MNALQSRIHATNNALVDRSKVEKSKNMSVDGQGDLIDKKELTPEEVSTKLENEKREKKMEDIAERKLYEQNYN
jgi:hypothetical protein